VAKFKEVLNLNRISIRRGIFITTSTFVPRALTIGIKTIDGSQLRRLERIASVVRVVRFFFYGSTVGVALAAAMYPEQVKQNATELDKWLRTNNNFYRKNANWTSIRKQVLVWKKYVEDKIK
jgi:hypothetical protein